MIRTQIYLPDETHSALLKLAKQNGTTLSRLIRHSANEVVVKHQLRRSKQQQALDFFANPPKKYQLKLTGKQLIDLVRKDRDE